MTERMLTVRMQINGKQTQPMDLPEDLMLLEYLQEYLNLTGTRYGCGQGVCRACAVIHDAADGPRVVPACITGVAWANGRSFRTVEGHATRDDQGAVTQLSAIQQAFLDHFSFQCSYCTPGFVAAATTLVERLQTAPVARDDVEDVVLEALNENICRCTGYVRYLQATRDVILNTPGLTTDEVATRDTAS
ncbi:(2Fe-2S)-binding protein [Oceaniglobus indicus]|uniref:(2Fe-2S)-binding protein n=1 Tax=Oceaniglobus indicus TaxID=2047749 RepID=UPI0019D4C997|nr:2Fe-2S iron-sulfur cluster-binding protein [Oceaniglobus indicus]